MDHDLLDPREWVPDSYSNMICFHGRYKLGDDHNWESPEDVYEYITKNKLIYLPLYLYDHSGITMNTTGFSCPWDSVQVGYIYMEDDKVKELFNVKRITKSVKEKALEYLNNSVKLYDKYLRGEVYEYVLSKLETCKCCGHISEDVIDSCSDYYDIDDILDEFPEFKEEEDKEETKHLHESGIQE